MGILKYWKQAKIHALLGASILVFITFPSEKANAWSCNQGCLPDITADHNTLRDRITDHTSDKFTEHRNWIADEFFKKQVLPALMLFTEQMSAVAMQQTMAIGTFLDAKHQLETQRLLQELQVEAHRDYQPSEDFCWFGTNVRSLAASEARSRDNTYLMSRRQAARQLGEQSMGGASDGDNDKFARWTMFLKYFCDPQDSDWVDTQPGVTGLASICSPPPGTDPVYTNADIDYTRMIDKTRTLNVNTFGEGADFTSGLNVTQPERAVFSLGNNLYGHDLPTRIQDKKLLAQERYQSGYLALRSITAKRSVAENSFNAIVGMKTNGSTIYNSPSGTSNTYEFLGPIMVELGIADPQEVRKLLGANPSYYAQLELLAKKIYQNPDFYSNLYDKPANVKRKSVALKAIELMVDRAIYESQIRQEMVTSVLLSTRLEQPFNEAQKGLVPSEK